MTSELESNYSVSSESASAVPCEREVLQDEGSPLQQLRSFSLPKEWSDQSINGLVVFCKIFRTNVIGGKPFHVTQSITIMPDSTWTLFVNSNKVDPGNCIALESVPLVLNTNSFHCLYPNWILFMSVEDIRIYIL